MRCECWEEGVIGDRSHYRRYMARFRPYPMFALVVWTLVLWAGRLDLAWTVAGGSTMSKVLSTVPVALFVVFALAVLVALLRRQGATARRDVLIGWRRQLALGLVVWTVSYWVVRLPMIVTDSHNFAFHAVHTVLAVFSWAFAAWAWRSLTASEQAPGSHDGQDLVAEHATR